MTSLLSRINKSMRAEMNRANPQAEGVRNLSRRGFLKTGALAGGGLILGVYLPSLGGGNGALAESIAVEGIFQCNAFVKIGSDDIITVLVNHSEMGQGSYTSLPMLVAEELDADWTKVRAEGAPVDPVFNHTMYGTQMVGGSTSVRSEWMRMRQAGAAARTMLIAAAAAEWKVDPSTCSAANGFVIHAATNKKASFGQLAEAASKLAPPPPNEVPLKEQKDFKILGNSTKRLDAPAKVNGTAEFGIDVKLPNMLVAVVARSPVFGGTVKSFNGDAAKKIPGVRHVVQIERGIAVVADGYWPAHKGREALKIEWNEGPLKSLDSANQRKEYAALTAKLGAVAHQEGDVAAAFSSAKKTLEAEYELPYLAHACMEPINAVADVRADGCDVYTGTQFQTADHAAAAADAGLKPEQVRIHTTFLGGGFGRKAVIDSHFVREAVQLSKQCKVPVKVIWSREDDTRGGYYRPAAYHRMRAGVNERGEPTAWTNSIVCQSFMAGTPFEAFVVKNGVDDTAVEGAYDMPYAIPNKLVDWHEAPGGVPTLWWRSVGHSHTAFAVECFIDELAHAAGVDPVAYRRRMLQSHPRHLGVMNLVAEESGWTTPPVKGHARGIAVHASFGSYAAAVADVSVNDHGHVRVHRLVTAIDCGMVVNPDGVHAQLESGAVFGLTAALYGEISFANGRVQERNFHDYPMVRMNEMPRIDTHVVPSAEPLGGVGEPCVPPIAPAVCNAIFAATGKRVRRLPIRLHDLKKV